MCTGCHELSEPSEEGPTDWAALAALASLAALVTAVRSAVDQVGRLEGLREGRDFVFEFRLV